MQNYNSAEIQLNSIQKSFSGLDDPQFKYKKDKKYVDRINTIPAKFWGYQHSTIMRVFFVLLIDTFANNYYLQ